MAQSLPHKQIPHKQLARWFRENQRPLPWRENTDPYRVWISETMLQQTTSTAVIPYFEKFLKELPSLESLAKASERKVISLWAGLGYYSRARNLHKAAKALVQNKAGFPSSHIELMKLPGFGPYTARAVASIAFGERVGVIDGNTIRFLSRFYNWGGQWWKTKERRQLQAWADEWARKSPPNEINQAMMELGATICTPQNPSCFLCPVRTHCQSHKSGDSTQLPLKKPRRKREIWQWNVSVRTKNGKVAIVKNELLPFLKGQWILPGSAERLTQKPSQFDFRHSITHHDIYVKVFSSYSRLANKEKLSLQWVPLIELNEWIPASLIKKAIQKSGISQQET